MIQIQMEKEDKTRKYKARGEKYKTRGEKNQPNRYTGGRSNY